MDVHPIQTGTVRIKSRQREGVGAGRRRFVNMVLDREWTEFLPILAWVIVHPEGLIVVDTGETARAGEPGYFPRWHPYYRTGLQTAVEPDEEIGPQLRRLGFDPSDVRWVVLTHLHTDHAGGLHHFPKSEMLVTREELALASGRRGRLRGYLNNRFPEWFAPTPIEIDGDPLGAFPASAPLTEAGDVRLVPVPGHTAGQMAVVLEDDDVVLFFAGDSSYSEALMLDRVADGVSFDDEIATRTLANIESFASERQMVYLPSHDPESAVRLRERTPVSTHTRPPVHAGS
jgi:glyoxylase-like metal-dependent hydrolase (beta-lactamase superfamily II)